MEYHYFFEWYGAVDWMPERVSSL